uniref:Uncharacterized protein n=1 Tax=Avena sativa TaxID=4498 RepID=A0ACD5UIN4_AVESA
MSDRRGTTTLDNLPEEIIIDQILVRLSPKDIGRCRAVCPSWRAATSMPKFMLDHHNCQPSLPIIDGDGKPASVIIFRDGHAGAKSSGEDLWPFLLNPSRKFHCEIRLHADCDGFLIVSEGGQFYICNPIICQHTLLPQPRSGKGIYNTITGLYQHHPTGEYRVLWVSGNLYEDKWYSSLSRVKAYILTVGSNQPRCISVEQPTMSSPSVQDTFELSDRMSRCNRCPPLHYRANLHWCHGRFKDLTGESGKIVVFDTMHESSQWMLGPQKGFWEKLLDMKGTLAFASYPVPDLTVINIWVMHDYGAQIWSFKYRIDMSMIEASRPLGLTSLEGKKQKKQLSGTTVRFFDDIVVLNESELLIGFNSKYVLHYNIEGKFLQMVRISKRQYCMELTRHRLQESIVPIPSGRI